ncbi:hypothetical protein [Geomesophilobacter sediminis]|uniref:Uncharacterized protein n=1 Tax=Geomesophilobacter sediminis TaxID=2798584 RepID=A0A8J7M1L3_9BACT|nr:hypothetical protein [Geomesophilobacter sediminis]MBJ6726804.1 hypothetical protein [Geomesophilobacter sediminis]
MDDPLPWPDEYKKLFVQGGDYFEFAHFGWGDMWQQFYGYCAGYKRAADCLVDDAICSCDTSRLDTVIFPVLFLYRQFIELSLKQLILEFGDGSCDEKVERLKQLNHDLDASWREFVRLLPKSIEAHEQKTVKVVEKYIREFAGVDKSSYSFRYPVAKNLTLIFGKEQRLNLRHLKERMSEIESFFCGVSGFLDDLRTNQE